MCHAMAPAGLSNPMFGRVATGASPGAVHPLGAFANICQRSMADVQFYYSISPASWHPTVVGKHKAMLNLMAGQSAAACECRLFCHIGMSDVQPAVCHTSYHNIDAGGFYGKRAHIS